MMKKKKNIFGPLLLLLIISATPRPSYANPTSTLEHSEENLVAEEVDQLHDLHSGDGTGNSIKSTTKQKRSLDPVATGVSVVADHLTKVINYLKVKISHTHYDKVIRQLESELDNLPRELNIGRKKMISDLYKSKTRIITTRVNLEQAAHQLKSYCQELLDIYDDNARSMRVLKYTAKKFNKYATFVMKLLKEALVEYKETQDLLSDAKASLKEFQFKLNARKREITGKKVNRKKRGIGAFFTKVVPLVIKKVGPAALKIGAGAGVAVGLTYAIEALTKDDVNKLLGRIEKAQERLDDLFNENDKIQNYVSQEIKLIGDWKVKLEASLLDNHHELTQDDIDFSIKHIKNRLIALKYACSTYLQHGLPHILQNSEKNIY